MNRYFRNCIILSAIRVPLLLVLGAVFLYLSAAHSVRDSRTYGIDDGIELTISVEGGSIDRSQFESARMILQDTIVQSDAVVVFEGENGGSVGIGVHDTQRRWPSLPFTADDYQNGSASVSYRHGSAASLMREVVALRLGGKDIARDFDTNGELAGVDYVYPFLGTSRLEGRLILSGLSKSQESTIASSLNDAGYQVQISNVSTFESDLATAPTVWVMVLILGLAWVSATISWLVQAQRLAATLRMEATLGAPAGVAAARQLPRIVISWLLAALAATLVTCVAWMILKLRDVSLLPYVIFLALLDLATAVAITWGRLRLIARLAK